jgi:hypothetical protein
MQVNSERDISSREEFDKLSMWMKIGHEKQKTAAEEDSTVREDQRQPRPT